MRFDASREPLRGSWAPSAHDVTRDDEDDASWWAAPRLTPAADTAALFALRLALRDLLEAERDSGLPLRHDPPPLRVLALAASHESLLPSDSVEMDVVGLGMNEEELCRNGDLSDMHSGVDIFSGAFDSLTFKEGSFDAVTLLFAMPYITRPIVVLREALRVLRPGGIIAVACGGRVWPRRATAAWRAAASDDERAAFAARCLHHASGPGPAGFSCITVEDLSPDAGRTDALLLVTARRSGGADDNATLTAPEAATAAIATALGAAAQ